MSEFFSWKLEENKLGNFGCVEFHFILHAILVLSRSSMVKDLMDMLKDG
jgi:hypothetical protein